MITLLTLYVLFGLLFIFFSYLLNKLPTSTPNKYSNFIFKNLDSTGYVPYIIGASIVLTWPIHVFGLSIGALLK